MFSATRFAAIAAIVFAAGGFLLVAQPFDQQGGGIPGAAETGDAVAPVPFTGRIDGGSQVRAPSFTRVGDRLERRGQAWSPTLMDVSDPRLGGRMTLSNDEDAYPGPERDDGAVVLDGGSEALKLGTSTIRIENDEGAWQGSRTYFENGEDGGDGIVVLVGEGAYEGLFAVLDDSDWDDVRGVIFPAPPPPDPTAP